MTTTPPEFRPDLLAGDTTVGAYRTAAGELPRQIVQRWSPAAGWQDIAMPPPPADVAAAAMWQHSQHCGAHHPRAGVYCTEDPGHDTSAGHVAKDEFGAVLRRWMGPDAYVDPGAQEGPPE